MERFTVGWKRRPPLYGPNAELNCTRYPLLTCTCPLSSSQTTRNCITRSGTAATLRAVLYSGFFSKRDEFSRVETSSVIANEVSLECVEKMVRRGDRRYLCKPVQILVRMVDSTWSFSFGGTNVCICRFENGCCWRSCDTVLGITLKPW